MKRARSEIDAVDNAILALLAQRARLVSVLWREKAERGEAVVDPVREAEIVARLRADGEGLGLNGDAVEATFRTIFGKRLVR